jgi:hypothetical protein
MSIEDRKDDKLPVTAEVGGEGGSYAEATQQAETFKGAAGNRRIDPKSVTDRDGVVTGAAAEGEQVRDDPGMVKHATEPPDKR